MNGFLTTNANCFIIIVRITNPVELAVAQHNLKNNKRRNHSRMVSITIQAVSGL